MQLREAAQRAAEELVRLTGFALSSVTAACRQADGWVVRVELVERRGVPDALDLLGLYEVRLDGEGRLVEFARKGLRRRNETVPAMDEPPEGPLA